MPGFRSLILMGVLTGGMGGMVAGQDPVNAPDMQMQSDIEDLMRSQRRTEDMSDMIDYFSALRQHPINLNRAGREDLEKILFLNDFQISSLLDYRKDNGPLYSINELQLVYGFDREVIRRIRPYITVGPLVPQTQTSHWRQELIAGAGATVEDEAGYRPAGEGLAGHPYLGNRPGFRFRYRIRHGQKLFAGVTIDQDAGEPFFTGRNPCGTDFCGIYLQVHGPGILRQVNAGRYALRFGQGLVLWNGFHLTKGFGTSVLSRRSPELRYASSAAETGYLQGLAAVLQIKRTEIIPFFSLQYINAHTTAADADTGETLYTGLLSSGLHRTAAEIGERHNLRERLAGLRVAWHKGTFHLGMTSLYTSYDHPLHPAEEPYNTFSFRGREYFLAGADYTWMIHNVSLFGEGAMSNNGAPALLQGLRWYASPLVSFSMLARYYAPGYHAFYARPFSETGLSHNEAGWYLGITTHPFRHLTLAGTVDLYHFPWLRYHADAPSEGTETRILLAWAPAEQFHADLQYKSETHTVNETGSVIPLTPLIRQTLDHLRLQIRYSLTSSLTAVSRVDVSRFTSSGSPAPQQGFWISQDLRYAPAAFPLVATGRFGLFSTQFATRIYTYENDLLYAFSTPSFTGTGIRWYLLLKYPLYAHGTMGLRVARTSYTDRDRTGTGTTLIEAPHKTEIKAQIRITF